MQKPAEQTTVKLRAARLEKALRDRSPDQRAAMRGALGDAAGLCDALAREIEASNTYGRGKITKIGQELGASF